MIPLVQFIFYIPALILGKPLADIFNPYLFQIGQYKNLVLNFSNIYSLIPDNYDFFSNAGLILSISIIMIIYTIIIKNDTRFNINDYILIFLITVMLCVYFLPSMHERYMFTADVLAVVYLFLYPKRFFVPFIIWFINFNAYLPALYGFGPIIDYKIMSILYFCLLVYLVYDLINNIKSKTKSVVIKKKLSYS